jgi:hypothetical protein
LEEASNPPSVSERPLVVGRSGINVSSRSTPARSRIVWSMIRKSGNRLSDKIMLDKRKTGVQSVQLETIAL